MPLTCFTSYKISSNHFSGIWRCSDYLTPEKDPAKAAREDHRAGSFLGGLLPTAPPKAFYWEDSRRKKESAFITTEKLDPAPPKPALNVSSSEGTSHPWRFPKLHPLLALEHDTPPNTNTKQKERPLGTKDKPDRQRGARPVARAQIKEFQTGEGFPPTQGLVHLAGRSNPTKTNLGRASPGSFCSVPDCLTDVRWQ